MLLRRKVAEEWREFPLNTHTAFSGMHGQGRLPAEGRVH